MLATPVTVLALLVAVLADPVIMMAVRERPNGRAARQWPTDGKRRVYPVIGVSGVVDQ
ncbi:hypothetical protein [Amycolatopsis sp. cmx-8-4]|uniref:hypothetical protein n=1 Tax=Amycolatopsis sp. cmx-8-4 TaxID=2790947 RepID=UPI00397B39D6